MVLTNLTRRLMSQSLQDQQRAAAVCPVSSASIASDALYAALAATSRFASIARAERGTPIAAAPAAEPTWMDFPRCFWRDFALSAAALRQLQSSLVAAFVCSACVDLRQTSKPLLACPK